jgi:hypothetical protein
VTSGIGGVPDDADIQPFERGETEYSRDLPPARNRNGCQFLQSSNFEPLRSGSSLGRVETRAALAEAGATAHEIAAVTGHMSLEEIERYTRGARKKKLADTAMAKLK